MDSEKGERKDNERSEGKHMKKKKSSKGKKKKYDTSTKKTGSFGGKSNALGHGGRAAQLKSKGVPGFIIGKMAHNAGAAPGGPNYHGGLRRR